MNLIQSITISLCVSSALCATVTAQDAKPKSSVLITGANIDLPPFSVPGAMRVGG